MADLERELTQLKHRLHTAEGDAARLRDEHAACQRVLDACRDVIQLISGAQSLTLTLTPAQVRQARAVMLDLLAGASFAIPEYDWLDEMEQE